MRLVPQTNALFSLFTTISELLLFPPRFFCFFSRCAADADRAFLLRDQSSFMSLLTGHFSSSKRLAEVSKETKQQEGTTEREEGARTRRKRRDGQKHNITYVVVLRSLARSLLGTAVDSSFSLDANFHLQEDNKRIERERRTEVG